MTNFDLTDELRNDFKFLTPGKIIRLNSIKEPYEAIVYKSDNNIIMAGFKVSEDYPTIDETFNSCRLFTEQRMYKNTIFRFLLLSCDRSEFTRQFSNICSEFLEPGPDGIFRKQILDNPILWWNNWVELLGNSYTEEQIYDSIAEMYALDFLFQKDKSITWLSPKAGVKDIESSSNTFEVKSTIKRSGYEVTISSPYQLDSDKPLWLLFCRMEQCSIDGYSINDLYHMLISHGYDKAQLDKELKSKSINLNNHICNVKYKIIEKVKYLVDTNFPKIIDASFVGGKKPDGVITYTYTIGLDNIPKQPW